MLRDSVTNRFLICGSLLQFRFCNNHALHASPLPQEQGKSKVLSMVITTFKKLNCRVGRDTLYHNMNKSSREDVKQMGIKISLAAARVNAGLTQKEAAELANISKKTLSSYERGKRLPKVDVLSAICQNYGCKIDDIKILS